MKKGFSMIEIMIAVVVVSIGVFPVYYLLTSGTRGITVSTREVMAVNHASSLMECLKGLSYDNLVTFMPEGGTEGGIKLQQRGCMVYSNESGQTTGEGEQTKSPVVSVEGCSDTWVAKEGETASPKALEFLNGSKFQREGPQKMENYYLRIFDLYCHATDKFCVLKVIMRWRSERADQTKPLEELSPEETRSVDLRTVIVGKHR